VPLGHRENFLFDPMPFILEDEKAEQQAINNSQVSYLMAIFTVVRQWLF